MKKKKVGAMSFNGGQRDNFYFCLLEYYFEENRWFLSSLYQIKEISMGSDHHHDSDDDQSLNQFIKDHDLHHLIVDFPLSLPPCVPCVQGCLGTYQCTHPQVIEVREKMNFLLKEDEKRRLEHPKKYEFDRKKNDEYMLSKPFKRRLKKGFLPYWNRPIDFWVWSEYYDHMLKYLKASFDSFSDSSLMLQFRFNFLKKNFSSHLQIYETRVSLVLLELMRSNIVSPKILLRLSSVEVGTKDRLNFIHDIEKSLKVFIYDHDIETLVKNPKAFHSFLMVLAGQRLLTKDLRVIPSWAQGEEGQFIIPSF